jgi:hypothetical protein
VWNYQAQKMNTHKVHADIVDNSRNGVDQEGYRYERLQEIESEGNWLQVKRKYLQLPIIVLEVNKVVHGLHEFGRIQKLVANSRSHRKRGKKNPVLTEFAQVPMRSALSAKFNL